MDSSDPIPQFPLQVRDKIWSFLNIADLLQTRLVCKFWKRWSIPRFRRLALIRLSPTLPHDTISSYLAEYSSNYLHQNFLIDTTFLQVSWSQEYINITMSMEFITLLFEEYGNNVKRLIFKHRDALFSEVNRLSQEQVLQFLYKILQNCPQIEELQLDVDVFRPDWFPEDRVFPELTILQLDSQRSIVDLEVEETPNGTLSLAERLVASTPNVETFITRELWSPLQLDLLSNMNSKPEDIRHLEWVRSSDLDPDDESYRWWPNLKGIKILERIRFDGGLPFGKELLELGGSTLDRMSRPLTRLHLGVIHAQQLQTAFMILNAFRHTLVEVEMSVEIKDRLIPNTLQCMAHLKRLSFVDCVVDMAKTAVELDLDATSSSDDISAEDDYGIAVAVMKKKRQPKKLVKPPPRKKSKKKELVKTGVVLKRVFTTEMLDFCNLSKIFSTESKFREMLPALQTLELTFSSGFRTKFYNFFFPGIISYPNIPTHKRFYQITSLKLNYPCLQLSDKYLGWTQGIAQLFPNVHNKHLNYARNHPEAGTDLNADNYNSSD